jgi:hypothetical protein
MTRGSHRLEMTEVLTLHALGGLGFELGAVDRGPQQHQLVLVEVLGWIRFGRIPIPHRSSSWQRASRAAALSMGEVWRWRWPVGKAIGSEAALLAEYGVSRAALHETIGLLEHHNVANMRRGPAVGWSSPSPAREFIGLPGGVPGRSGTSGVLPGRGRDGCR